MVLFRVRLDRLYFGIHNKILDFHNWSLFTMNSFTITERKENQWIYQWICDIQIVWTVSYLILQRIIVFELFEHWIMLIVFLFLVLTISKFYSWIFEKHDWTSNLAAGVLPIISVLFICPSICLSFCLWCIFLRPYSVDFFNFLHEDVLPYILKCDEGIIWKIVFFV